MIERLKRRLQQRFQGLYWRQLFVTAGMVLLTLSLAGAIALIPKRKQSTDIIG